MPFKPSSSHNVFVCRQCGDCCKGYGGTYVTDADIDAIAAFIDKAPSVVRSEYCRLSGRKPLLKQRADGFCIFWEHNCTIHPVKPRMCRAWPFIESVLVDIENWRMMGSCCPGIRTDCPDEVVRQRVRDFLRQEKKT